jgi:hypothetical protein
MVRASGSRPHAASGGEPVSRYPNKGPDTATGVVLTDSAGRREEQRPTRVIVQQSPKYVLLRNPNMAFDGKPVIAVLAAEAERLGLTND